MCAAPVFRVSFVVRDMINCEAVHCLQSGGGHYI